MVLEYVRGALRILKKLANRGIKRTANIDYASTAEIVASSLIRWVNFVQLGAGFDEMLAVKQTVTSCTEPHIVCVASRYKRGNMYVTFHGNVIPCGMSSIRAIEVLFKCLPVFALEIPIMLRKLNDMLSINAFGTKCSSKCKTVSELTLRYKEFLQNLNNGSM